MSDFKIRNSTSEFLMFTSDTRTDSIEVKVEDETVWLTQKLMAQLFEVGVNTINYHLKELFKDREIEENSTIRKFRIVQKEGNRSVERELEYYNLKAIIAVGFKTNSEKAIEFRIWANNVLHDFAIKGYALDKERLKNGTYLSEEYFDELIEEIKEIRASERKFYQKITDIYATAFDYNKDSKITREFFKRVQNKMHFAIHGNTAAEVIMNRANAGKEYMGLTTWKKAPDGKIQATDVVVAKNYLTKEELKELESIVVMYIDYALFQARRKMPMSMNDWNEKLDAFLKYNDVEILQNRGKVTHEIAEAFALSEFEKYRVIQDRLYQSDFDKILSEVEDVKKSLDDKK